MNKVVRLFLLIILLGSVARAGNIAGGEIGYKYLNNNFYSVHVKIYTDCASLQLMPVSIPVQFTCLSNSSASFVHSLNLHPSSGSIVSNLCPTAVTTCDGGLIFGMREYLYQSVVSLTPAEWNIIHNSSYRNTMTNIVGSPTNQLLLIATLDNSSASNNSSPVFGSAPNVYLCEGQLNNISNRVSDPNEDSLVYSLISLQSGSPGQLLIYANGYSATAPFGTSSPVQFNNSNGEIVVTAASIMIVGYVVLVEEYRSFGGNYAKIGSCMRDFQVHVNSCNNIPPQLSGINSAATQFSPSDTNYSISVCAGEPLTFKVFAYDFPNVDNPSFNNMTLSWTDAFAGPAFYTWSQNTSAPVGYFTWVPTNVDAANSPITLSFVVNDNNCPYSGSATYHYTIEITPSSEVSLGENINAFVDELISVSAQKDVADAYFYWKLDNTQLNLPMTTSSIHLSTSNLLPGLHQLSVRMISQSLEFCDSYDTVSLFIRPLDWLGTDDFNQHQPSLHISPNPFTEESALHISLAREATLNCELLDVFGRTIQTLAMQEFSIGYHRISLSDMQSKSPGVYFIRVRTGDNVYVKRFVVQ